MKRIEKLHQCLIWRCLISFSSSSIVFGMAPPYSTIRAIETPCSHSLTSLLIYNAPMAQDRCTHIAVSLPAWFRCPRPRLSWQPSRVHEMSWEYVHISNMTLDEVGEQAFHWVLPRMPPLECDHSRSCPARLCSKSGRI